MSESSIRILITVVVCIGILAVWQSFFAPKKAPLPIEATEPAPQPIQKRAIGSERPASRPATSTVGPVSTDAEGKHSELEHEQAEVVFTDRGAALRHWKFTKARFVEQNSRGELKPIDMVQTEAGKGPWPLTTTFPNSDFEVPDGAQYRLVEKTTDRLKYEWASSDVRVTKEYLLDPTEPVFSLAVTVENLLDRPLRYRLSIELWGRQAPDRRDPGLTNPYPRIPTGLCFVNGELMRRSIGAITGTASGCSGAGCSMGSGPVVATGNVQWIGADYVYFLTAVVPQGKASYMAEQRRCEVKLSDGEEPLIETSLLFAEAKLPPGGALTRNFNVYVGPKDLNKMDAVIGMGGEKSKLGQAIEFGWVAVLCRPMLWLMQWFYSWVGNWGLAIILLTVVIKLVTLYWTQKSMRSMKQMQRLKPKMDVLRAKYKDDKQRLNQEVMNLYKLHKVNPLGGCLPMVIQIPVWFALYRTLGTAQELYRSGFVGWINDLTAPDPFYVLPIAMGAAMYLQQAITPQPLEGNQAKMMKYFMPGMFTMMMLWLPAGLTLYIFTNTVLTMLHQWHMNRTDPEKDKPPGGDVGNGSERAGLTEQRPAEQHSIGQRTKRTTGASKAAGNTGKTKAKGSRPRTRKNKRRRV